MKKLCDGSRRPVRGKRHQRQSSVSRHSTAICLGYRQKLRVLSVLGVLEISRHEAKGNDRHSIIGEKELQSESNPMWNAIPAVVFATAVIGTPPVSAQAFPRDVNSFVVITIVAAIMVSGEAPDACAAPRRYD